MMAFLMDFIRRGWWILGAAALVCLFAPLAEVPPERSSITVGPDAVFWRMSYAVLLLGPLLFALDASKGVLRVYSCLPNHKRALATAIWVECVALFPLLWIVCSLFRNDFMTAHPRAWTGGLGPVWMSVMAACASALVCLFTTASLRIRLAVGTGPAGPDVLRSAAVLLILLMFLMFQWMLVFDVGETWIAPFLEATRLPLAALAICVVGLSYTRRESFCFLMCDLRSTRPLPKKPVPGRSASVALMPRSWGFLQPWINATLGTVVFATLMGAACVLPLCGYGVVEEKDLFYATVAILSAPGFVAASQLRLSPRLLRSLPISRDRATAYWLLIPGVSYVTALSMACLLIVLTCGIPDYPIMTCLSVVNAGLLFVGVNVWTGRRSRLSMFANSMVMSGIFFLMLWHVEFSPMLTLAACGLAEAGVLNVYRAFRDSSTIYRTPSHSAAMKPFDWYDLLENRPKKNALIAGTAAAIMLVVLVPGSGLLDFAQGEYEKRPPTPEELGIEKHLAEHPEDLDARIQIIKAYDEHLDDSEEVKRRLEKHVLWMIENHPGDAILKERGYDFSEYRRTPAFLKARKLWRAQVRKHPQDAQVLGNAADFFSRYGTEKDRKFLEQARAAALSKPEPNRLGCPNLREANSEFGERQQQEARIAPDYHEETPALNKPDGSANVDFDLLAREALSAGQFENASGYAGQLLASVGAKSTSNTAGRIHDAHILLGLAALGKGNDTEARECLLRAADVTPSENMAANGPNMILANRFLELGDRETVIQYVDISLRYWGDSEGKLTRWRQDIKAGRVPDFGDNLKW